MAIHGGHLGLAIRMIFVILGLVYFLLSFELTGLSVQKWKCTTDFQDGSQLEFLILAIFDLQVTLILPIKF